MAARKIAHVNNDDGIDEDSAPFLASSSSVSSESPIKKKAGKAELAMAVTGRDTAMQLHCALGHIKKGRMLELYKASSSSSPPLRDLPPIKPHDVEALGVCPACEVGKHQRSAFLARNAHVKETVPGKGMSMDMGVLSTPTRLGEKYFNVFVDSATSHGMLEMLDLKDENFASYFAAAARTKQVTGQDGAWINMDNSK
jgi:hypothetical protein